MKNYALALINPNQPVGGLTVPDNSSTISSTGFTQTLCNPIRYIPNGVGARVDIRPTALTGTGYARIFDARCQFYELTASNTYSTITVDAASLVMNIELIRTPVYEDGGPPITVAGVGYSTGNFQSNFYSISSQTGPGPGSKYIMRARGLSIGTGLPDWADSYRIAQCRFSFSDKQPALYQTGVLKTYYDLSHTDNQLLWGATASTTTISQMRFMRCHEKIKDKIFDFIVAASQDSELEFVPITNAQPLGSYSTTLIMAMVGTDPYNSAYGMLSYSCSYEFTADLYNGSGDQVLRAGDQAVCEQLITLHRQVSTPSSQMESFPESVKRVGKSLLVSPLVKQLIGSSARVARDTALDYLTTGQVTIAKNVAKEIKNVVAKKKKKNANSSKLVKRK